MPTSAGSWISTQLNCTWELGRAFRRVDFRPARFWGSWVDSATSGTRRADYAHHINTISRGVGDGWREILCYTGWASHPGLGFVT